jgi:hypothetical protein
VVTTDTGRMEIEWGETAVWSVAEVVRRSTAEDTGRELSGESVAEMALRKLKEEVGSAARRRGTERAETHEGFEYDGVLGQNRFSKCATVRELIGRSTLAPVRIFQD